MAKRKSSLIFDKIGDAIAAARHIAKSGRDVIAAEYGVGCFRVYVGRETYSVVSKVVYTNLWDMNAATNP